MWLKLSDDLWNHPKFVRARGAAGEGRALAIMGLWLEAALYCARYGTDGKITLIELRPLDAYHPDLVEVLIGVQLWERAGDGGYQFHDWQHYQLPAEKVRKRRLATRERMRQLRASKPRRSEPAAQQEQPADADGGSAPPPPATALAETELGKPDSAAQRDVVEAHRGAALLVLDALNFGRKQVVPTSRGTKKSYRTLHLIAQRLAEGATVEDALHVVKVCVEECRKDPAAIKWFDHVSPFRPDNFERKRVCPLGLGARPARVQPAPTTGLGPEGLSPYAAAFDGGPEEDR